MMKMVYLLLFAECRLLMRVNLCLEDHLKKLNTRFFSIVVGNDCVASILANDCDGNQQFDASSGQTVAPDSVLKLSQIIKKCS